MAQQYSWRVYIVCAFAAIGGLLFGYDTGVLGSILTMPHFIYKMKQRDYLTSTEQGTLTGLLLVGCFVGSLIAGQSAEILSRKITIILGCVVFMAGAAIQTATTGYGTMLAGRAIAGLGVGTLSMIVPLYQSELAPKEIRGRLISFQQLMTTVGLMLAFWVNVGTEKIDSDAQFRIPIGIQIAPAFVLAVGAFFLPYSPRWLFSKGREEEALEVLAGLHANGDKTDPYVVSEFNDIRQQCENERKISNMNYAEVFNKRNRRRLFLGIFTQVFQQFTGINSIMYYAPTIFQQAGITNTAATLIASGVNGVLNMLSTIPAVIYLDRLGRRKTLISGAITMGIALLLCGIVMAATGRVYLDPVDDKKKLDMSGNTSASYFCIVMIYIFVAGFAFSWGPVGWVYPAEIFPLNVRAKGTSISTAANWLMNFVISQMCPAMLNSITWGTYIFFGGCCAIITVAVWTFYPETKGKSLEEMDAVFSGSVWAFRTPKTESFEAQEKGDGSAHSEKQ